MPFDGKSTNYNQKVVDLKIFTKSPQITSLTHLIMVPEAATGDVLLKKVFLKIYQDSQEITYARVCNICKHLGLSLQFY